MEGTRINQHHPRGDGAGQGDIIPPRAGVRAAPKPAFGARKPLAPTPSLGQLRIPRTRIPRGKLGRLGLPGSGRAAVEPAPSPSIILISPAGSPPGPGSGAARRETGRRQRGDKPRHKQKQLARPETSKHPAGNLCGCGARAGAGKMGAAPRVGGGMRVGCAAVVHACRAMVWINSVGVIGMLARGEARCPALGTTQ